MSDSVAPGYPVTVHGLISDPDGRWLIVQPVRRGAWQLPGGIIEAGEAPRVALAREVREELGLFLRPDRLLTVAWIPASRPDGRARFNLLFDLGELPNGRKVRLGPELREWCWATPDQSAHLLHPLITRRLREMRQVAPSATYIEHVEQRPTVGGVRFAQG
ncbi:MAG: NUDIX domain-containing protein [Sporichthyaceae bacterium]|nr:NUDIX domain-containing protein [Sporichthyaceae bacterium]